ncbi:hypothetical protein [Pseudoroseomonas ludipueritiae]|uniref:Uncharacterized protein n=1 Tax=Pseudoroseomonas ludipueritiae TaxID=198093 RepID=A0ABR7R6R0_9PROT|nr:hypothetical protein [Pseudoroseomonas ludipueritiae]MBC9177315.1 hypothetical protein [Pseudoroseomonas ludipueritiae]
MSLAASSPAGREAALSLALWPEPEPEPDWVSEISMALPPLPESLPPVTFSLPPGSGDPYERLLAALSGRDGRADSIWFG